MSEHLAFGLFLLSLLSEMSGQEQTYNPLRHRHFYKSQEIYSEKQLRACVNYIHNNPIKAKICKFPYQEIYSL